MKLISSIRVPSGDRTSTIELLQGDLTEIPPEHAVDVLVVSAFPNEYRPHPGTLIAALDAKNVFLDSLLEKGPEADLRKDFGCWLSRPIEKRKHGLAFTRILCFEPLRRGAPPEVVSDIFRALAPFVYASPSIRSVAMPVVATGPQRVPISVMLPALMEATWNQLAAGLPLEVVKIVVFDEEALKDAKRYFRPPRKGRSWFSRTKPAPMPTSDGDRRCDVFISYSREDQAAAHHFANVLSTSGLKPFVDTLEIEPGASWQQKIWDALAASSRTAVFYSPSFISSKVCQDEFNTAMILRRRRNEGFIFPVLVRDCDLPAHMEMLNFHDCRPTDKDRLTAAAQKLAAAVRAYP